MNQKYRMADIFWAEVEYEKNSKNYIYVIPFLHLKGNGKVVCLLNNKTCWINNNIDVSVRSYCLNMPKVKSVISTGYISFINKNSEGDLVLTPTICDIPLPKLFSLLHRKEYMTNCNMYATKEQIIKLAKNLTKTAQKQYDKNVESVDLEK